MTIRSVSRAFAVLETLATAPGGLRLQELSRRVGLHKATAFRLVRTLVQLGYVKQDGERETYALRQASPLPRGKRP
jgi:DNA-binding IclR family transcriptional regulator